MDDSLQIALVLLYAYLLGSVPAAWIVARLVKGIDLRKVGSGTIGASNVYYNVGRFWILPVGIFDLFVKGLTPVYLARTLGLEIEVQAAAGLLAVIGHNWPVSLGFKGGRGVAPSVGALLALGRLELAFFIVITSAGWQFTKASGVWVLLGFVSLPLVALYFQRPSAVVLLMTGLLLVTVVKRLASNSLRGSDVPLPQLLFNRLMYDRDIADHDAWVQRNTPQSEAE
ncbi:MAG: glycerol-3-phosphate acyltransferase [Chloroflexi bacterium]|nr:glycerol-3-phosphate acyltransferase [Chloroflexota bacterium]